MRRIETLETNNNCTWETVYDPIYNSMHEAYHAYDDKDVFFGSTADDFEENFVQDLWSEDGNENLGKHIQLGFVAFPYNESNWKEFTMFFNTVMDDIKKEHEEK